MTGPQMVSLLHLADIDEEGVRFQSPIDGGSMLLTPEHSIQVQNRLGADIIMALDDVVPSTTQSAERCAPRGRGEGAGRGGAERGAADRGKLGGVWLEELGGGGA